MIVFQDEGTKNCFVKVDGDQQMSKWFVCVSIKKWDANDMYIVGVIITNRNTSKWDTNDVF